MPANKKITVLATIASLGLGMGAAMAQTPTDFDQTRAWVAGKIIGYETAPPFNPNAKTHDFDAFSSDGNQVTHYVADMPAFQPYTMIVKPVEKSWAAQGATVEYQNQLGQTWLVKIVDGKVEVTFQTVNLAAVVCDKAKTECNGAKLPH
jgi:hypothetical protein